MKMFFFFFDCERLKGKRRILFCFGHKKKKKEKKERKRVSFGEKGRENGV